MLCATSRGRSSSASARSKPLVVSIRRAQPRRRSHLFRQQGDWGEIRTRSWRRRPPLSPKLPASNASPGRCQLLPDAAGRPRRPSCSASKNADARDRDPLLPGKLATLLPAGVYRFANAPHDASLAALAFLLGLYRFSRYRAATRAQPSLVAPDNVDGARIERIAEAVAFGRDLVNTPANDLGPDALEQRGAAARRAFRRQGRGHARRRPHRAQPAADSRRRPRRRTGAAPRRFRLGPRRRGQSDARRQGRDLRHRRPRHQAGERDGDHEEGHGRRGGRAQPCAHDHGGGARRAPAHADADRREFDFRQRFPAGRRPQKPQGPDRRDRQYRRRRPVDPRRRA